MAFIPVKFCKPYCPIFQSNLSNSFSFSLGGLPINAIQPPQLTNTTTRGNRFGPLDFTKNLEVHMLIHFLSSNEPVEKFTFLKISSSDGSRTEDYRFLSSRLPKRSPLLFLLLIWQYYHAFRTFS
jgi:hypothetical protein